MSVKDDLVLAHRLADAAGKAIRQYFRADFAIERKSDASPVTEADRAAEKAMRDILEAERPNDAILGEEFGEKAGTSGKQWVLDPIDGTTSFIAGRPIFGSLIAMLQDGWPIMGVIDQPINGERWAAYSGGECQFTQTSGAKSPKDTQSARTRPCPEMTDAILATTSPHLFSDGDATYFMNVAKQCATQRMVWGGDCYNYGLLASGHIDIVMESGLKLHDFAALIPIVEAAGGMMCDWNGEPLHSGSDGYVIAIGDPARLEDVLEAMHVNSDG